VFRGGGAVLLFLISALVASSPVSASITAKHSQSLRALVAATTTSRLPPPPPGRSQRASTPFGRGGVKVCGTAAPRMARCNAVLATNSSGTPLSSSSPIAGYFPANLQSAYQLPSSTAGTGETVAIVDAYNDPNAESDLAAYRSQFGLPACTTANGCFQKVNQTGGSTYPTNNGSWAQEISVDLDMVSAICPNCHILLVEATSASISNLGVAVDEAATLGANAISNSYGSSEFSGETSFDPHYNHPGIMVTVSSGDSGYGTQYPAASPYVTAVGGTSLTLAPGTLRGWSETAWSGAGSGCSSYESKPSWQKDNGCGNRTIADASAVADPNTGVAVYDSVSVQGSSGWLVFGGTSVASPIIASVYALGGNTTNLAYGSSPYSHTSWLNDMTSGSNGTCGGSYLCTASPGYDGPTGFGTPAGDAAFGGVPSSPTVTGVSPSSGPSSGGTVVTVTGTGFVMGSTFTVDFGSSPASNVSVSSPEQLTATSPSGSGLVSVVVTTPAGTSSTGTVSTFNYPPSAPTNLSATAASSSEVDLSWTSSAGATGYNVLRSTNGTSFTQVAADVAATNYADTQYLRVPGPGASVSTPDSAALDITGNIDIRVRVALGNWANGHYQPLVEKHGNYYAYDLAVAPNGTLFALWGNGTGSTNTYAFSTAAVPFAGGSKGWLRTTRVASTGVVTFYTSSDGITWTQLGTTVSTTAGALYASTDPLYVGSGALGYYGTGPIGDIYYVEVRNGINGTVVASPDFTSASGTSFSDAEANPWSIGGGASLQGGPALSSGTTYYYEVQALDAGGPSGYSNVASATTPTPH
jgi:hypothetical protein